MFYMGRFTWAVLHRLQLQLQFHSSAPATRKDSINGTSKNRDIPPLQNRQLPLFKAPPTYPIELSYVNLDSNLIQ